MLFLAGGARARPNTGAVVLCFVYSPALCFKAVRVRGGLWVVWRAGAFVCQRAWYYMDGTVYDGFETRVRCAMYDTTSRRCGAR